MLFVGYVKNPNNQSEEKIEKPLGSHQSVDNLAFHTLLKLFTNKKKCGCIFNAISITIYCLL